MNIFYVRIYEKIRFPMTYHIFNENNICPSKILPFYRQILFFYETSMFDVGHCMGNSVKLHGSDRDRDRYIDIDIATSV